jgi:hypothetical protein
MSDIKFLVCKGTGSTAAQIGTLALFGTRVDFDGTKSPKDYDLLVLDGPSLRGADFIPGAALARTALENDKPVLVMEPTDEQKKQLAAAGALHSYPNGDCYALLIEPRRDAAGTLRLALAEQSIVEDRPVTVTRALAKGGRDGSTVQGPADTFTVRPQRQLTTTDIDRFIKRVRQSVTSLKAGAIKTTQLDSSAPSNPPSNIPTDLYDVTPVNLYYALWHGGGTDQHGYTPPNGYTYFEGVVYIGVYFDNKTMNQAIQWLNIEHSGMFYTNGMVANDSNSRGWSVAQIEIKGDSISGPTLVTKASSPNNVNNSTEYTTSTSFTVGIDAGVGPDGGSIGVNASYSVSNSETHSVTDWAILQSSPNWWCFYQQNPYDGRTASGSFPGGAANGDGVAALPALSAGGFAYATSTVYQHLPATNTSSSVGFTYNLKSNFTHLDYGGKSWAASWWGYPNSIYKSYTIAWNRAWC